MGGERRGGEGREGRGGGERREREREKEKGDEQCYKKKTGDEAKIAVE